MTQENKSKIDCDVNTVAETTVLNRTEIWAKIDKFVAQTVPYWRNFWVKLKLKTTGEGDSKLGQSPTKKDRSRSLLITRAPISTTCLSAPNNQLIAIAVT